MDLAVRHESVLMTTVVYLNGRFVQPEEAKISLFDHGYLFGDGVFETLRAYDGKIFRLGEHLRRLYQSARYFHLTIPSSSEGLSDLCYETLSKSGLENAYLRVTVSRGAGGRGIDPEGCKDPTLSIIAKAVPLYPQECYETGMATKIVRIEKTSDNALSSQVKCCNYLNNILAKIELNQEGLLEGFLLNSKGFIAEGTVSNVFIVKRGRLLTPSPANGCLQGITRNAVIEIAGSRCGIAVEEGDLTRNDLYAADECFITNTIMELMPVKSVDGRRIGSATPGSMTQRLSREFKELLLEDSRK